MLTATETPAADYQEFLAGKTHRGAEHGFEPRFIPAAAFPFQSDLIRWAQMVGRGAVFADCGLGKTLISLSWARNVVEHAGRRVLILTPLAVAPHFLRDGLKFGIDAERSRDGERTGAAITIANYERLHKFDPADFAGVVCDESSAIKAFDGKRRAAVTAFLRHIPYRLLSTATAAPNDYIELGTSSEALGRLGHVDMLNRFFVNDRNTTDTKGRVYGGKVDWRFKGHAEEAFWRWVCSWARAVRRPSDLGYPDQGFDLPPLEERTHMVEARRNAPGMLFAMAARNFHEEREERRRTITERCEKAAELAVEDDCAVVWCHLNPEGDLLAKLIPDSVQVAGSMPDEQKEEAFEAFASGEVARLITKPKIGAWGLNWQHCRRVVTFCSHSYETYYQTVRRCWRYGQTRPVIVDMVASEGEKPVLDNVRRKARQADKMFDRLVGHMHEAQRPLLVATTEPAGAPAWLQTNA